MSYSSSVVGQGCFGKVHKRYYNGKLAAIKIVPFHRASEEDLLREYKVYKNLNHKNVVKLLGPPKKERDGWHIPMAFIEGTTLDSLIFNGPRKLSEAEKYKIILGMCEGLCHLHENKIAHQDLKPDNIMIEHSTNQAVIIDLGLAKFINYTDSGRPFSSGRNIGCAGYTAPEVDRGMIRSRTSDVWSMGKVIAEVLLEYRLSRNDCRAETINHLLRGLMYVNLVCQMLQERPEKRISMKEVLQHLNSFAAQSEGFDWGLAALAGGLASIAAGAFAAFRAIS